MAASEASSTDPSQQARWNRIAERGSLWGLRFTLARQDDDSVLIVELK